MKTLLKDKARKLSDALKINLKRRKVKINTGEKKKSLNTQSSKLILILVLLTLTSCLQKIESVGYFISKDKISELQINQTSKSKLLEILGEPTMESTVGPKIYYYMQQQYRQIAFLQPKLDNQKIVAIELDFNNLIKKISIDGLKQAHVLHYDSDQTSLKVGNNTLVKKFLMK